MSIDIEVMRPPGLPRRAFAEFLATFALVFAGCGAVVSNTVADGALGLTGMPRSSV